MNMHVFLKVDYIHFYTDLYKHIGVIVDLGLQAVTNYTDLMKISHQSNTANEH